jgi:GT2 family glycosyltransferase
MDRIAVIIPVHNRLEDTKKCLKWLYESINNSSQPDRIKVILVDDGSCDGTSIWVAKHYSDVIILNGSGDLWWSGAVNLGARFSLNELHCDCVLLWNNDIKPDITYFSNVEKVLETIDDKTIVGSKIFMANKPEIIFSMGGIFNPKTGKYYFLGMNKKDSKDYARTMDVDCMGGMGTLIPKAVIEKTGYWDAETFPQYKGDTDFTLRAKKAGTRLLVNPDLKIWNNVANDNLKQDKLKQFVKSLFSLRSPGNIIIDFKFYKKHATSIFAYRELVYKYFRHVSIFFIRKILHILRYER